MTALSSTSTLAEVQAAYDDNASYEEEASVSKAKAFVTACRLLIRRLPQVSKDGEKHEIQLNLTILRDELIRAQRWVYANDTSASGSSGGVSQFSLNNLRG